MINSPDTLIDSIRLLQQNNLLTTAFVFIITTYLGIRIFVQTKELQGDKKRASEQVDAIAETVRVLEQVDKFVALEQVVKDLPSDLTQDQFRQMLEAIVTRIQSTHPQADARSAVEELINNYHEQALDQAKAQFWFSITAATVGFAWILYSGASIQADKLVTVSKTFPGVVMDAVAFLFFRQASETRQRATELYDRLRRDKQMSESKSLVGSIEDVRLRSAVLAQLALHMSGLQPNAIDLGSFLSSQATSERAKTALNQPADSAPS